MVTVGKPSLEGPGWWWHLRKHVPDEEDLQKPLTSGDLPGLVPGCWNGTQGWVWGLLDTELELSTEGEPSQVLSQRGLRRAGPYPHAASDWWKAGDPDVCLSVPVGALPHQGQHFSYVPRKNSACPKHTVTPHRHTYHT